jgi:quinoprotein glucose dehydrogenase
MIKPGVRLAVLALLIVVGCKGPATDESDLVMQAGRNYPVYGGNKAGNRYSPLNQVDTSNVTGLQQAWSYFANNKDSTGEADGGGEIQCQPIVVNGMLYGTSTELNLFALDAATGRQVWKFEPIRKNQQFNNNRGVMYWEEGEDKRIFYTAGAWLYAVNALSGKSITTFGSDGRVDLHEGLGDSLSHDVSSLSVKSTSPGVIYKNTLVMGSSVSESGDAAPGHVRAFDVVTGKLKWVFHTIPLPGEPGYETWPAGAFQRMGAANTWGGLSVDEKRGTVYFGTGSPSCDFYGGDREGSNLYANCIISLDAQTGKLKWYFQAIRHDLWDRDFPCQPNLATITHAGRKTDVVVQAGKDGLVYVLDRETGKSIFPIEERPVPVAGLPGEHPYPTQLYPLKPLPLSRQVFTEADITNISPAAHEYVKKAFAQFPKSSSNYEPPGEAGTLLPGYSGGAEWGGNAVDPAGIFYQNANEYAWELKMISKDQREKEMASLSKGNLLYSAHCAACHGADRKGSGDVFPSLLNIQQKKTPAEIGQLVKSGKGRMPAFQFLSEAERNSITAFLLNREARLPKGPDNHIDTSLKGTNKPDFPYEPPYSPKVWRRFNDQDGYNALRPPWGTLNAIDLNTGDYLWRIPLGEYPELTRKGVPITGTDSYGGPVVTAGGLIFIASTRDEKIRAFNKRTGQQLWEHHLPAGGFATPITYEASGKQFIAIAAGGGRGSKDGGWYVAFSLK